jgi:hypothetical protein
MSVNDGTYSKKQTSLGKNQTQSQNAQGRWVVTTKAAAPKSGNTPAANSYTDFRNEFASGINSSINNTAPGKTVNPTSAADVMMWGIPAKYASEFSAQFNLQLKAGVYDSFGNVSTKAIATAIRTASGLTSQKFNVKENVLFDPIQKFFGIKDMNSESPKTGLGKVAISIEDAAGNWAFVTNPGNSGVSKLGSTLPNIPKASSTPPGGGGVSAEAAATINAKASAQVSAYDGVLNTLDSWGMVPLMPTKPTNTNDPIAMADYQAKLDTYTKDTKIMNDIKNMVYGASTQQVNQAILLDYVRGTDAYKQAFPGLAQRNAQVNASEHLTESAYQNLISTYRGTSTQYGLPTLSNAQIASLVQNNISASEFNERVTKGYTAALNADPATRAQLAKFGVNTSDLAHYYLDPKNSISKIEQTTAAAALSGYSQNVGLKGMTESGARELADRVNLGVGSAYGTTSMGTMQQSLLNASRDVQLTAAAPGSGRQTVTTDQLIGSQVAGYGGTNQIAEQTQVARAEQSATQQFSKGGGYAESGRGVSGIGSAKS